MTERPIRVLLVDGQIHDSRWVQELLVDFADSRYGGQQWMQGIDVFHLDRLEETLLLLGDAGAKSKEPGEAVDVILLNPALPDSFGLPTLLKVQAQAPQTPVIILSDVDDPDLAVSLVRAGAQEFLVKQELDSVPLARALRLAIERVRMVNGLRALSWRDPLTGLYNHSGLEVLGGQQIAAAERLGHMAGALVVEMGGLDELAKAYGHEERDVAVIEVAEVLKAACEAPAVAGYLGGNRFAVLFPTTCAAEGHRLCTLLRRKFHQIQARSASMAKVRFRYGQHAGAPHSSMSVAWLMEEAAAALCENMGGAPEDRTPRHLRENDEHHAVADAYRS